METWYFLVLAGIVCGVLSAMFGVGSGIVMVPLLVIGLAFPQKAAQGTALAVMVPMALVGAIRYKMNPEIAMDTRIVILLSIGGVLGALLGTKIISVLPGTIIRKGFAVLLIISAVNMFFKTDPKDKPKSESPPAKLTDAAATTERGPP